jgi:hypothetical protein
MQQTTGRFIAMPLTTVSGLYAQWGAQKSPLFAVHTPQARVLQPPRSHRPAVLHDREGCRRSMNWSPLLDAGARLDQPNRTAQQPRPADLEVTPVLRTFDGRDLVLPALTLRPDQVQKFDLQALAADLNGPAGFLRSVLFRYNSLSRGNLYAAVIGRTLPLQLSSKAHASSDPRLFSLCLARLSAL